LALQLFMARRARNETEPGLFHVYARGVERRTIFGDDDDRRLYLSLLEGVVDKFRWHCLAYCLMPNHVHLLIETTEPNLGRGMHMLHGLYAQAFNQRWARVGHLFQDRFGSRVVHDEVQLAVVLAYVAVNPVAAGLCADPADWPWSSHRALVAGTWERVVDVARLAEHLAPFGELQASYRTFVETRLLSRGLPLPA
jgi:putative transposase